MKNGILLLALGLLSAFDSSAQFVPRSETELRLAGPPPKWILDASLFASDPALVRPVDFADTYQHGVFESVSPTADAAKVQVFNPISQTKFQMSSHQIEFERSISRSVFFAVTGTGTAQGTAFLVGKDLVLTNNHVVANHVNRCDKFGIYIPLVPGGDLDHSEFVACKEIVYCGQDQKGGPNGNDFCVVRLQARKSGHQVGEDLPILSLSSKLPAELPRPLMTLVGYPGSETPYATSWEGAIFDGPDLVHFARAYSGDSGSPVVGADGIVFGIHYGRQGSGLKRGDFVLFTKANRNISIASDALPKDFMWETLAPGTAVNTPQIIRELSAAVPQVMSELTVVEPGR